MTRNIGRGVLRMATSLQLKLLSAEEVSSIYDKCLDHLSSKGVKVEHPQALRILDKAGAWVDFDNQQVRFPKDVIEMALRKAPHALTLAGSNYSNDIVIPDPRKTFYTITEAVPFKYHDPDSKTYPDVTLAHLAEWAQLVGALGEINSCGYLTPADVPAQTADIHALKVLFENTSKPIHVLPYSLESVEYLFQLALVVAGSAEALKNRPYNQHSSDFSRTFCA
jgi:trimethylamine--corrinoid protein Co-methyltransferase